MKEEKLYPVLYNNKLWNEEECSEIFVAYYHIKEALNAIGGVYLSEGTWVYPDGTMDEW